MRPHGLNQLSTYGPFGEDIFAQYHWPSPGCCPRLKGHSQAQWGSVPDSRYKKPGRSNQFSSIWDDLGIPNYLTESNASNALRILDEILQSTERIESQQQTKSLRKKNKM